MEIKEELLQAYSRPQRVLIKTIKRLFNQDLEASVLTITRLFKECIVSIFSLLQCKYMQNQDYDIYSIREELLSDMLESKKSFFTRFSPLLVNQEGQDSSVLLS